MGCLGVPKHRSEKHCRRLSCWVNDGCWWWQCVTYLSVEQHHPATVKHAKDTASPEALLSGRVPELQLDRHSRLDLQEMHIEVHPDCLVNALQELVLCVALDQRGFAHRGIPQHDDPELVLPQREVHGTSWPQVGRGECFGGWGEGCGVLLLAGGPSGQAGLKERCCLGWRVSGGNYMAGVKSRCASVSQGGSACAASFPGSHTAVSLTQPPNRGPLAESLFFKEMRRQEEAAEEERVVGSTACGRRDSALHFQGKYATQTTCWFSGRGVI